MTLEENDKPSREMDHFSRFLLGRRENDNSPELPEQKESFESRSNRPDDWIFGNRRKESPTHNQNGNPLNTVDLMLLMETFDMFVATTNQFKPLFKEVTPFLNRFIKKFKSN